MSNPPPPIRVLVRVRPREGAAADEDTTILKTQIDPDAKSNVPLLCLRSKDASSWQGFKFDGVLDGRATQSDLMSHFDDIINGVLDGVSCTAFAYGQTASGKSYSLIGKGFDDVFQSKLPWNQARSDIYSQRDSWGVIPRSIHELFAKLESDQNSILSFTVRCSFMQIYNDKVFDLLASSKSNNTSLPIREDSTALGGVTIHGLLSKEVGTAEQALKLLHQGGRRRTVRETSCNERSSRSHAIFRLSVETCSVSTNGTSVTRRALLNLVDCAGSERWGSDERSKLSATELTSINTSLSALGNCVSALAQKSKHIPFRSSALTRILKDCLGGGARAIIIATVHSTPSCRFETASTLAFASRALRLGKILPNVKVNEKIDDAVLLKQAKAEIRRLKMAMEEAKADNEIGNGISSSDDEPGWEEKVKIATAAIHEVVDAVETGKIKPTEVGVELKSFFSLSRKLQASIESSFDENALSVVAEETMQRGENTSEQQADASVPANQEPLHTCQQEARSIFDTQPPDLAASSSFVEPTSTLTPILTPRSLAEAKHEELCTSFDDCDNDQRDTSVTNSPLTRPGQNQTPTACERHQIEDCFLCKVEGRDVDKANGLPVPTARTKTKISNKSRIRQRNTISSEPRPRWTHRSDSFPSRKRQENYSSQQKLSRRHSSIPEPTTRSPGVRAKVHSTPKFSVSGQNSRLKGSSTIQFNSRRPIQSRNLSTGGTTSSKRPPSSRTRMRPDDINKAKDRARMAIAEASRVLAHM